MNEQLFVELVRQSLWATVVVGAPLMLTALVVGLAVSLIQALTQMQEMTLTFVPKVMAIFAVAVLTAPFMLQQLTVYTEGLFARIANGGAGLG